jgi:hypothetical protein
MIDLQMYNYNLINLEIIYKSNQEAKQRELLFG